METKLLHSLKLMGQDVKEDNIEKYIENLEPDEYKLLLILHHCFELFALRKLPEPKFIQKQNLYRYECD